MKHVSLTILFIISLTTAQAFAVFSFDEKTGKCVDAEGNTGHNKGIIGTCGDFSGKAVKERNFRNLDLRGSLFVDTRFLTPNFDGADLRYSTFSHANLERAQFQGAQIDYVDFSFSRLQGAWFWPSHPFGSQWFQAEYDRWTQLPFSEEEAQREGMIYREW